MALIARVSSASTFALFLDACFFLRLSNFAFFFTVFVVFVVDAALVPLPFVFTAAILSPFLRLICIGLRICLLHQLSLSFLPYHHHINFSLASAAITSHFVSILHIVANGVDNGVI
jgi:hypothetical protein